MYVCLCKGITDADIRRAVDGGADSFREVRENLGVATVCGSCACTAKELVKTCSKRSDQGQDSTLFYSLA